MPPRTTAKKAAKVGPPSQSQPLATDANKSTSTPSHLQPATEPPNVLSQPSGTGKQVQSTKKETLKQKPIAPDPEIRLGRTRLDEKKMRVFTEASKIITEQLKEIRKITRYETSEDQKSTEDQKPTKDQKPTGDRKRTQSGELTRAVFL